MAPSKPAYDVDWVFSNNSDVHVANHRDWFTSYTPFPTNFDCSLTVTGNKVEVTGIGDVELRTKTHPTKTGAAYQHKLVLRNVLYAPSVFCNILGGHEHHWHLGGPGSAGKLIDPATGKCIGLLDSARLFRLRLRGQSSTQTSLDKNTAYFVRANWAPSERSRWQAYQAQENGGRSTLPVADTFAESPLPPLTQPEKKWLKDHYGGEFHFLQVHGLSIYKDEDREEGRSILRALMNDASLDDEESENSFLREIEADPTSHAADYHFTEEELDWIKKAYGHSRCFLMSYGLKFYDDEDCREGRRILRALMDDDDEEAEHDDDEEAGNDDSGNESENSFLRELEEDPTSHVADYHFSEAELDWIKSNYGHSGNFLLSHGLKFYDDDDCREGKAMVQMCL
ncbi:MAG: hypothetical protein Q9194_004613 [Teloschistes cf. exilis]